MAKADWDIYAAGAVEEKPDPAVVRTNTLSLHSWFKRQFKKAGIDIISRDTKKGTIRIRLENDNDLTIPHRLANIKGVEQVKMVRIVK